MSSFVAASKDGTFGWAKVNATHFQSVSSMTRQDVVIVVSRKSRGLDEMEMKMEVEMENHATLNQQLFIGG